jgi:hypothetical protein
MSYKQLTAADFADKSPEDIEKMVTANESGLKISRDDWMEQANGSKVSIGEKDDVIEAGRLRELEAEKTRLLDAGKYEDALNIEKEENKRKEALIELGAEKTKEILKSRDLGDFKAEMMLSIHEDPIKRIAAQSMIDKNSSVTYDEQGNKTLSMKIGDKEFSNTVDFLAHAETDATWKAMLKAPETKGLDVHNSNAQGGGNSGKKYSDMSLEERSKLNSN